MHADIVFKASLDRTAWIITTVAVLVLLCTAVLLLVGGIKALRESRGIGIFVLVLSGLDLGFLLVTLLLAPMKYVVRSTSVTICRLGPDIVIPVTDISKSRVVSGDRVFGDAIRVCASGGVFGYYGKWSSSNFGKFDAYATRTDYVVVIDRKSGIPVVLSPDDPQEFAKQIDSRLK